MKRAISISLLLLLSLPAFAKKDPAVELREQAIHEYRIDLEKAGVYDSNVQVKLTGKQKDVITVFLLLPVDRVYWFKEKFIDPLLTDEVKSRLVDAGFRSFLIRTYRSETFPKGEWEIPLVNQ